MKHDIVKTDNYLLVVDDSEIKEGDWYLTFMNSNIIGEPRKCEDSSYNFNNCKKIIAHLPFNNSPILRGVDLLPPLEDDVEKLAKETTKKYINEREKQTAYLEFIEGHTKAKEKYRFTEEDMRKAFIEGTNHGSAYQSCIENEDWEAVKEMDENDDDTIKEIIQSLSQPKIPVGFSTLDQWYNPKTNKGGYSLPEVSGLNDNDGCYMIHSVITNSQGQTVWVGNYIY